MKYNKYFIRKTRTNGDKFYCKTEDAPSELVELTYKIRKGVGLECSPNDWLYAVIYEAFYAIEEDNFDIEDQFTECDIHHHDLLDWMKNPYAYYYYEQAREDGIFSNDSDIYDQIGWSQIECKNVVYHMVNEFIKRQNTEEEYNETT